MHRLLTAGLAALAVAAAPLLLATPAHAADTTGLVINEVESNGGTPGDWVELYNPGTAAVDASGWIFKDNDDAHAYALPAGTVVAPGGHLVLDEAQFGFGLGGADSARLFNAAGTQVDAYAWTTHAAATYGRVPDGTGAFTQTPSTKGAANAAPTPTPTGTPTPAASVVINETVSTAGVPGDWIELKNTGTIPADVSGYVVKDNDDTHAYTIPAGTTIPAGGYLVVEEAAMNYGLGGADSARLFTPTGTLVDSWSWTAHAPTSWARCADGTGAFVQSSAVSKGAANACTAATPTPSPTPTGPAPQPWPGSQDVAVADVPTAFTGDLSGLDFADAGTLYGVVNGTGELVKMSWNGTQWVVDRTLTMHYTDGTGTPDSEGVSVGGDGMVYVGTERNNQVKGVSRLTVLKVDPNGNGTAAQQWDLTSILPAVGPNTGIEAIEIAPGVPTLPTSDPNAVPYVTAYVGIEETGAVHEVNLYADGTASLVRTLQPGLGGVMALDFVGDTYEMWALCDDGCQGTAAVFKLPEGGAPLRMVARPTGMPNLNNEGFALSPECVDGRRMAVWADDGDTDGTSLRVGYMDCVSPTASPPRRRPPPRRPRRARAPRPPPRPPRARRPRAPARPRLAPRRRPPRHPGAPLTRTAAARSPTRVRRTGPLPSSG